MIPHNKPTLGKEESDAIARIVDSAWVAEGKEVAQFESAFSTYLGMSEGNAVAVSSGTSALYLALHALGVKEGSEVILPTYTCSAILNAINMTGATAIIVDIDEKNLNLSFDDTKKKMTDKTAAIIVTHTFGIPIDVRPFMELGVPVIEDCAQALGARVGGELVGTFGTIATFSFYASKVMTTGYGGMVVSRDSKLIDAIRDYRAFDGRETYTPRFNFHLSDINAAMGIVQLGKLEQFLKRRRAIADLYKKLLPDLDIMPTSTDTSSANFYRILLHTPRAAELKAHLESNGVASILPIEQFELLHRYLGQDPGAYPAGEHIASSLLSLPAYPSLSDGEVETIAQHIRDFFTTV
jgi:perosamine synthetase